MAGRSIPAGVRFSLADAPKGVLAVGKKGLNSIFVIYEGIEVELREGIDREFNLVVRQFSKLLSLHGSSVVSSLNDANTRSKEDVCLECVLDIAVDWIELTRRRRRKIVRAVSDHAVAVREALIESDLPRRTAPRLLI